MTLLAGGCGKKAGTEGGADAEAAATAPVAVQTAKATVRPVETTVSAQGTLAAGQGQSARVAATTAGRISAVYVREGDTVRAGQAVAALDNRSTEAQARSAAAAVSAASAQAASGSIAANAAAVDQSNAERAARLAVNSARLDRSAAVQTARTALQAAQTDLARTRAGARPQEIAQADLAARQAQATRDRAATEVERVRFLVGKGVTAQRQLDDAQTALAVADAALESARAQANLVRAGARTEDVRAAELRVRAARETLAQAQTGGDARVRQAEAALQQARQSVLTVAARRQDAAALRETAAQRRADLAAAQVAAGTAVLRAPIAGVVTRRAANPGDQADPATPFLEIADIRTLDLVANLPAEEGATVRPGMAARVTSEGREYWGRVLSVGQVDPQTNLLAVRIAVSNPGGALKGGAFATAMIVVRTEPRAVVVPKEAVVSREGSSVVFSVGADGAAHQRTVTLGPEQGGYVQVVRGLQAGETVIRLGQYELTDGAKVRAAGKEEKEP